MGFEFEQIAGDFWVELYRNDTSPGELRNTTGPSCGGDSLAIEGANVGPACCLLIPLGTHKNADAAVKRLLKLATCGDRYGFGGRDTRPIGGQILDMASPLCCGEFRLDPEIEGYEDGIEEAFGFRPDPESISISACCNLPDDHRALALVAAYLAEQTGGVIDLDRPPWSLHRPPWSDASLPGRVRKVCWNGNRKFGWKLLLDGEAMRAWSRHPDCRMPK